MTESESAVLPLNYPPTAASRRFFARGATGPLNSEAKAAAQALRFRAIAPAVVFRKRRRRGTREVRASNMLDRHHSRRGLQRAGERGADRIAAGQADFDLAVLGPRITTSDTSPSPRALKAALDRSERRFVAHEHPQALVNLGGRVGQSLDIDDARAHVLALDGRLQRHQHVRALLEEVAELVQALLEQDRLVSA